MSKTPGPKPAAQDAAKFTRERQGLNENTNLNAGTKKPKMTKK